jgi:hypothetical protein
MHFIVAVGLLRVLHVGQSHSPGLGLNMSASDGSSEEAARPFAADIPSPEFLTASLAGCTGTSFLSPGSEKTKVAHDTEPLEVCLPTPELGFTENAVVSCSS